MLRSMNSAISGMQAFEQQLDVVGNNIANVNTTGFKAGSTEFEDMLSQNMGGGSQPQMSAGAPPMPIIGGTNPIQIGLGVKVAAIDTNFTQGADQTTGVPTNVAINGPGLFTVSQDQGSTLLYTREGDFSLDAKGNLVLPNGAVAMGVTAYTGVAPAVSTPRNPVSIASTEFQPVNLTNYFSNYATSTSSTATLAGSPALTVGTDGSLTVTDSNGNRDVIGYLTLMTPPNPSGLTKVGGSLYESSANSGTPVYQTPGLNNSGTTQAGALEASNVDLTLEFSNMIVAQRGFDANSHMIGTDNAILNDIVNLKNG